jgi:hypothetical protein
MMVLALSDYDLARALGLGFIDHPEGEVSYRVRAIDANGKVIERGELQDTVRGDRPSPLCGPPQALRASISDEGVALGWDAPDPLEGAPPAVLFEVLRRPDPKAPATVLNDTPTLLGAEENAADGYLDTDAPVLHTSQYSVRGVDPFGRRGEESKLLAVYFPDFAALLPPTDLEASAGPGEIDLSWEPNPSPNTAGYLVGRGANGDGPFATLTPQPIQGTRYVDRDGQPGTSYYYVVYAADPTGQAGEASLAVQASFQRAQPLPAPENLRASRGRGEIELRWDEVDAPALAGYRVERAVNSDGPWLVVSDGLLPRARLLDHVAIDAGGEFLYRVVAVGLDGEKSPASVPFRVRLADTLAPASPRIVALDGEEGVARVEFEPTGDPTDIAGFLVLRASGREQPAAIVSLPALDPSTREFIDDDVVAGRSYFYRVVAVDAAGNRSPESSAAEVLIGVAEATSPAPPGLQLESEPYRRVRAELPRNADLRVRYELQRERADGRWLRVDGPISVQAGKAYDNRPPAAGTVRYRWTVRLADGSAGPAGEPASLELR